MTNQHLGAVNVVVRVSGTARRNTDELIDCRVLIQFESREPQYYHTIISKDASLCKLFVLGKPATAEEFAAFIQDGVWLHVQGTSALHFTIRSEEKELAQVRTQPELYASCEVHLVACRVNAVSGGI